LVGVFKFPLSYFTANQSKIQWEIYCRMNSTYRFSYAKISKMFAASFQLNAFMHWKHLWTEKRGLHISHSSRNTEETYACIGSVTFCTEDSFLHGYKKTSTSIQK